MDTTTSSRELEAVRVRRAELREVLDAFQRCLATPDDRLPAALDRLAAEFALHVEVTEGPDGLHQAILAGDLRLANQVEALAAEHGEIADQIVALAADPEQLRAQGAALAAKIVRHRERGAELIYEAYEVDLGGCD
jgi:hypothetical protein